MSNLTYLNDASVLHNLKQRYYAKLIYVRLFHPGKKKKENVSPFLFSFFFRVFVSSPSTVNRDESVDRLCTNENVGQRHRIDVSPRFFSYSSSSSSSNKIHPRLFENCMFFREISILTRHAAFMQFFLQNASFYKTRTRVTTYLSLSPSPFFFSKKLETIAFVRLSSLRSFSHRSVSLPKQEETSLIEFWNSRIRTRDISFFFPFATNLPRTNAQYHWKIDDDDDEKPRHLVRFLETTISIRLARSTLSFSRKRERRFANQETKKKKERRDGKNLEHRSTNRDRLYLN